MSSTNFEAPSKKGRFRLFLILVVVATGITLAFKVLRHKDTVSYFTQPVERGSIATVVNATGIVEPVVTVQVGTQVSGQIEALYADFNSIVKRGQLLAKLDPRNFQAQVEDAKANLAAAKAHEQSAKADLSTMQANLLSAKANLDAARVARDNDALNLKRYKEMSNSGIIAENDFDTVRTTAESSAAKYNQAAAAVEQAEAQIAAQQAQLKQAAAQVQQAEADLDAKQVSLEYTNIFSPVDGVIISRNVDVGQTVAAGLQAPLLFVIANDLTHMQVNASVDEADIGNISPDVAIQFMVDAFPNRKFTGKVQEIRLDPQTVQNVVTYSVIIGVDNRDLYLKPGMTANITMTVEKRNDVLKIPNAALRYLPAGVSRAQEMELVHAHEGSTPSFPKSGNSSNLQPGNAFANRGSASNQQRSTQPQKKLTASGYGNAATPGSRAVGSGSTPAIAFSNQAPGQLWNPSDKIQFPTGSKPTARPGAVWIVGSNNEPLQRTVMLGITDGTYTELVSGDLKNGEGLIVSDSSQDTSNAASATGGLRGPFGGFGGRR